MTRLREIPYNYTSFSDREIITRLLGREERQETVNPQDLKIGGIITCASGVGVGLSFMLPLPS